MNEPPKTRLGLGSFAIVMLLSAHGCDEADRFSRIELDTSPNCSSATLEVLIRDLHRDAQPWSEVGQVIVSQSDPSDFWALVRLRDPSVLNARPIAVVHVEDGRIDGQFEISDTLDEATDVELRQGAFDQDVWLMERGPGAFRVTRFIVNASGTAVERSSNLAWFPSTIANLCEDEGPTDPFEEPTLGPCDVGDWHRDLAFLDKSPYIVSVPPFSPNATMFVYTGALGNGMGVTEQTQLEFFRTCDDEDEDSPPGTSPCARELAETTYPKLDVMGEQRDLDTPNHHLFIARTREIERIPQPLELVAVSLGPGTVPKGFVYSTTFDEVQLAAGASSMALDRNSAYLLHPVEDGAPRITRLRTGDGDRDRFDLLAQLNVEPPADAQMLQMNEDVAVGWIDEGRWLVTKLFPDAPERSELTTYAPSAPVTEVRPAGNGAFLVLKDHEDGPDLVRLRCNEE